MQADNADIFLVSETTLDNSFQVGQFIIKGLIFRLDRKQNGGGLLLYVRDSIPCKASSEYISANPI